MNIKANIEARRSAETIQALIADEAKSIKSYHGDEAVVRFYGMLHKSISSFDKPENCWHGKQACPMTDSESRVFEEAEVPFGKHAGKLVGEVELDYLEWLADQPDEFKENVRRYLKSRRVENEQRAFVNPAVDG